MLFLFLSKLASHSLTSRPGYDKGTSVLEVASVRYLVSGWQKIPIRLSDANGAGNVFNISKSFGEINNSHIKKHQENFSSDRICTKWELELFN